MWKPATGKRSGKEAHQTASVYRPGAIATEIMLQKCGLSNSQSHRFPQRVHRDQGKLSLWSQWAQPLSSKAAVRTFQEVSQTYLKSATTLYAQPYPERHPPQLYDHLGALYPALRWQLTDAQWMDARHRFHETQNSTCA